jgi:hypothetical protein
MNFARPKPIDLYPPDDFPATTTTLHRKRNRTDGLIIDDRCGCRRRTPELVELQ